MEKQPEIQFSRNYFIKGDIRLYLEVPGYNKYSAKILFEETHPDSNEYILKIKISDMEWTWNVHSNLDPHNVRADLSDGILSINIFPKTKKIIRIELE